MRVIAGEFRGRRLAKPPDGVRPTSDRVRESVFARLGSVDQWRVLDLFAGTGALGIEALSRGAVDATFVDRSARSLDALRSNLSQLGITERSRVVKATAAAALRRLCAEDARFDLIFLDPPYADFAAIPGALETIAAHPLLSEAGVVVVETSKRHAVSPTPGLAIEAARNYGDTTMTWLVTAQSGS